MIELERIGWENYPSTKTPRNAENLNKMEENTQKAITELENDALKTKILNQKVSVIANQEKTQAIDYTSIEGEIIGSVYIGSICSISNRAGITKAIPQIGGIVDSDMNRVTHIQICSSTTQDIYTSILVFYKESNADLK